MTRSRWFRREAIIPARNVAQTQKLTAGSCVCDFGHKLVLSATSSDYYFYIWSCGACAIGEHTPGAASGDARLDCSERTTDEGGATWIGTSERTVVGALSSPNGKLDVRWSKRDDGSLCLEWKESRGPNVAPPTRRGFGSQLIEGVLAKETGWTVKVEYRPSGLTCQLVIGAMECKSNVPALDIIEQSE